MTPSALTDFRDAVLTRQSSIAAILAAMDPAPEDSESTDPVADAYAEAIFLRSFTAYENELERLFLHYVTGGLTLSGAAPNTYLRVSDESLARKLTKAGFRFLSWAKPSQTRETASTYIENGWPIADMMSANAQDLSDCEKLRNRIAHNSLEAAAEFNSVQRNLLQTERLFNISPGQLLRIRSKKFRKIHIERYITVMNNTILSVIEPPG
jgi:hypothetical protein